MRRFLSVVFYILAGLALFDELMFAFLDVPETGIKWAMVGGCAAVTAVFLGIGAAISPGGRRLQEAGLTILITAGLGAVFALVFALIAMSPESEIILPDPTGEMAEAFAAFGAYATGVANALIVTALGVLAYRKGARA